MTYSRLLVDLSTPVVVDRTYIKKQQYVFIDRGQ
jgi:hypothetical protein